MKIISSGGFQNVDSTRAGILVKKWKGKPKGVDETHLWAAHHMVSQKNEFMVTPKFPKYPWKNTHLKFPFISNLDMKVWC